MGVLCCVVFAAQLHICEARKEIQTWAGRETTT